MLQDQYRALMQYSIPKECHVDKPPAKNTQDWHCVKVRITCLALAHRRVHLRIPIPIFAFRVFIVRFCFLFLFYSVERTISNGAKPASNVPHRERRARRAERAVTRSAHIRQIPYCYGDWTC